MSDVAAKVVHGQDEMGVHYGKLLWHVAKTYPSLVLTLVELVQNGIDAGATEIFVGVDLQDRRAVTADNGRGVTVETFRRALRSVGDGIKEPGSLGRFGLGMISPITNCRCMNFISRPEGSDEITQWTFVGESIRQQREAPRIPSTKLGDLPRQPTPFRSAARRLGSDWQTVVELDGIHEDIDNHLTLQDLVTKIRESLGAAMRVTGTNVHVLVRSEKGVVTTGQVDSIHYDGEPLPVVEYVNADCGRVVFELYRARRRKGGLPEGKVSVRELLAEKPYLVAWKNFRAQAMGLGWLEAINDALNTVGSGIFEGVISVEGIELDPTRTKFVANNALYATYMVIYQWYEEHGQAYVENQREAEQERRLKKLGEQSLARLANLLATSTRFGRLALKLQDVLPSTSQPGAGRPKTNLSKPDPKGGKKKRVLAEPPQPRERNPRASQGAMLRYAYEILPQSTRLWEYDPDEALLTFNIRHPVWVSVDEVKGRRTAKTDRQVIHLQEWLTLELLELLSRQPSREAFEMARDVIDTKAPLYVELVILGG